LVKDFARKQYPEKTAEVEKAPLARCIKNYIDDTNAKMTAELATWLGNDETHYMRIWEDKDIEDLKLLIRITSNWISNYLDTQDYVSSMKPDSGEE